MVTGLFFGSFNPIHVGHLAIAQYMINETDVQKVRFIVSPRNPFKKDAELMDAELRMDMVKLSIAGNRNLEVSGIELGMPLPNYTADTLKAMHEAGEKGPFRIIMGSDTLMGLPNWKEPETILQHPLLVYKRSGEFTHPYPERKSITLLNAPMLDISATAIRQMVREGKSVRYLVRDEIINLLKFS